MTLTPTPSPAPEQLTPEQIREERLLMGLRLTEGVGRSDVDPLDDATVARLADLGLLTDDGTLQMVKATVPDDAATRRFLHLRVTHP